MTSTTTRARAHRVVFPLLGAVQVTLIAAITLLAVPLPAIQREFGLAQGELALLSSGYGLAFGGLLLLGGRLADLRGAHRTLRAGLTLFGAAGVAGAAAPAFGVLLAARLAQGAGAALAAPAALALVTRIHPEGPRRARALAVWGTLSVSGAVGGSLLSGLVASVASWRWCLLLPVAVAVAGLLSRSVRHAGAPAAVSPGAAGDGRERLDLPGALLGTGGLVLLGHGLLTATGPAPAVAGLALLAAFAVVESRTARPLLPPRMLVDRARRVALPVILVTAAASAAVMFFLSLYFQQVRGMSAAQTSAAFLPNLLVLGRGPGDRPVRAARRCGRRAADRGGRDAAARHPRPGHRVARDRARRAAAVRRRLRTRPRRGDGGRHVRHPAAPGRARRGADQHRDGGGADRGARRTRGDRLGPHRGAGLPGRGRRRMRRGGRDGRLRARLRDDRRRLPPRRGVRRDHQDPGQEHRCAPQGGRRMRFTDRIVLITGGGTGAGRVLAEDFAREGATVVVAGRTAETLDGTVKAIEAEGGRAEAIVADVRRAADVAALVDRIVERHRRLDVAVNNAGVLFAGPVAEMPEEDWRAVFDTNVHGVFLCMKYEIAAMRAQPGGGTIVNVSSVVGPYLRVPGMAAYGAAKAAVSALTRTAALEYIRDGVRINAVTPGPMDTPMSLRPGETEAERAERVRRELPAGRVGSLAEFSAAVRYLASPESAFTVGHDLVLDGGATA